MPKKQSSGSQSRPFHNMSMRQQIKDRVRENFDGSPEAYEEFEKRSDLFSTLSAHLIDTCGIRSGMQVCDVGCGSGIATGLIARCCDYDGSVAGVDLSKNMLEAADERLVSLPGSAAPVQLIRADAESLSKNNEIRSLIRKQPFDAVLFNLSAFLIPDLGAALSEAARVMVPGGIIGLNLLSGTFGSDGHDLLDRCGGQSFAPYGRPIINAGDIPVFLEQAGFTAIERTTLETRCSLDEYIAFQSIPAQSAAFYPRELYASREAKLRDLSQFLSDNGIGSVKREWTYYRAVSGWSLRKEHAQS